MKKIKLLGVFFLAFIQFNTTWAQLDAAKLKKLDKYIENARKAWNIPGMAVAIVQDGQIIHEAGYGKLDATKKAPVNEHSLFSIASNTKAFTATTVGLLVDEGKLGWDDPVINYLPYFRMYNAYVTQNMTVRDLLSHHSGLVTFSGDLLWYGSTHARDEIIRRSAMLTPQYGFRTSFGYSNIHYLAAGQIVTELSGSTWDDFLRQRILKPLGMNRTLINYDEFSGYDNVAQPHHVDAEGNAQAIPYVNWDNIAPAGSMVSSVHDISQWIKLQLNDGKLGDKQLIPVDVIDEMRNPHTSMPLSRQARESVPGRHFRAYGLGWDLFDYKRAMVINHGGGADGMISKVVMVPEENFGFVILTNSINYLPTALMYKILDVYFDVEEKDWSEDYLVYYKNSFRREAERLSKMTENQVKNTKPSLNLEDYTGTYTCDMYGDAEVSLESGRLVVNFVPTPIFEGDLEHYHYDVFTIKLRDVPSLSTGTVRFVLDENGKSYKMKVDIPNPDFDFTELKFKR